MTDYLKQINTPADLQILNLEQLKDLADEIRNYITECVSTNGGHLSSNLGLVESIIALHSVFNFSKDRLVFDVGHQCYAHKILSGRKEQMKNLRKENGLLGFPDPDESIYDQFKVGHAGTAIPTAVGLALGAGLQKTDEKIVALVGDASIVNGTSFEGLNNLALVKRQLLIVLNDNSMAIDVSQGSIAKYLSKIRLSHTYEDMRKTANTILEHLPLIGRKVEGAIEKFKKAIRMAISASQLFESMNIAYFGPIDGHDINSMVEVLEAMKDIDHPAILHIYTKKGKGYSPADINPTKFHSTGPFELNGDALNGLAEKGQSYTDVFGDALSSLGDKDSKIVAITAAMPDGTGLVKFRKKFPNRFFDVGIAECAAVDIAAGIAKTGLKPVVCIYSTFAQRSFDQIFQEACLNNLPIVFVLDRAGVVGTDGPTHHGLFDIAYLRCLPNIQIIAPACLDEVGLALEYAANAQMPVAIRYPKDAAETDEKINQSCNVSFEKSKSIDIINNNSDIVLVCFGAVIKQALQASLELKNDGINTDIINARFAKPIDDRIISLAKQGKTVITIEDGCLAGGFGSAVLEKAAKHNCQNKIINLAAPDEYIPMASRSRQFQIMQIDAEAIIKAVRQI